MATINDRFNETYNASNPTVTTVSAPRTAAATSLSCTNLSGWPTNTAVHFSTYKLDTAGNKVAGSQTDWKGLVSGTTIGTLTRQGGAADSGNAIGDVVEMGPTASWANDFAKGMEVEHNQNGTHAVVTATSITTTGDVAVGGDIKVADTKSVKDGNSNELIKFSQTSSAVNELTVANAATGNNPTLTASGGDTNVGMTFATKGTGKLQGVVENLKNPYKFRVHQVGAASTGNNAYAVVAFDTEDFDTGSNISAGVFTAPISGFYQFNWAAQVVMSAGADESLIVSLFVNGSTKSAGQVITYRNLEGSGGSDLIQLAANDTVDVRAFAPTTRSLNVSTADRNYFSGFLVSAT